jgi:hypothetical protein
MLEAGKCLLHQEKVNGQFISGCCELNVYPAPIPKFTCRNPHSSVMVLEG